ncbi:MAG TPA: tRNA lysidine(34) synthetase TilS [Opitutaceae bacterium]|nr:tRNA lysidine(34) synthetase TilS [Opitutaceae bacterium]
MPRRDLEFWKRAADALAARVPRARLHPAVLAFAARRSAREKWGVAFSGGADSLALLLLLWAHWPERRRRLLALHFDHRLRGRASRQDAAFCRRVSAALGVKFVSGAWTKARRGASEAEARAARLAFFEGQARVLWLGHQQDDIAETMLMRLARGSGTGGLAAPRPVQRHARGRVHLRPLLTLKKTEIASALTAAGIPWREDATNAGGDFFRNRVRRDVVPAWIATAQRDAVAGAARARELLEEDDEALERWAAELAPIEKDGALPLRLLAGKPRALLRRALHRWLLAQRGVGELSRQAFEALLEAVARGETTRHSIGAMHFALIRRGVLRTERHGKRRARFQRRAN